MPCNGYYLFLYILCFIYLKLLKVECGGKLAKVSQGKNYTALLKQLIVQGLIKIEEDTVEIQCRQEDISKVQQVVS
jgi:hypothetical protein